METTLIPENLNIEQYQQNIGECLKSTTKFTEVVYHNLCTGDVYSVPAGFWDFAIYLVIIFFIVVMGISCLKIMLD